MYEVYRIEYYQHEFDVSPREVIWVAHDKREAVRTFKHQYEPYIIIGIERDSKESLIPDK